jgi:CDP-diacylglycerol--serine O-phosphatidyltransferase
MALLQLIKTRYSELEFDNRQKAGLLVFLLGFLATGVALAFIISDYGSISEYTAIKVIIVLICDFIMGAGLYTFAATYSLKSQVRKYSLNETKQRVIVECLNYLPKWITPNILTLSRVVSVVIILTLLYFDFKIAALVLFIVSASTDWLDGQLARQRGEVSRIGKFLDPLVDKLHNLPILGWLGWRLSPKLISTVITIDIITFVLGTALSLLDRYKGASNFGKWKTTFQITAIIILFLELNIFVKPLLWLVIAFGTGSVYRYLRQLPKRFLPNVVTGLNLLCGVVAIVIRIVFWGTMTYLEIACWLIPVGIISDLLDGRLARRLNACSVSGAKFDSIADLITFGLAPAVIVSSLPWHNNFVIMLAIIASIAYGLCTKFRLDRFDAKNDPDDHSDFFVGLPSPMAAGLVVFLILVFQTYYFPMISLIFWEVVIAFLMISKLQYPHFELIVRTKLITINKYWLVGFLGLLAFVIVKNDFAKEALLIVFSAYVLFGSFKWRFRNKTHKKIACKSKR